MASYQFTVLLVASATLGQQSPGPNYYAAATAATRTLTNQVLYLQQAIVTLPQPATPPAGDQLFKQTEVILASLQDLRQGLNDNAGRESLVLTFVPIDRKLNALLRESQGIERWNAALRMTARRVRYAQQDLHFAIFGTDGAPETRAQVALRQTLALQDRTEDCLTHVRNVFFEQQPVFAWNDEFAAFQGALNELLKLEQTKAPRDDIKKQLLKSDQYWAKLVKRFNKDSLGSTLSVQWHFAQVDHLLDRLSMLYGVPDRRPPLKDPFGY
jgi:hypothetical protein